MQRKLLAVFLLQLVVFTNGANILGIFTSHSPSHNIVHMSTVKALVEKGHNVTVITILPIKDKNPKYHHVYIKPPAEAMEALERSTNQMANGKGFEFMKLMVSSFADMVNMHYNIMFTEEFQSVIHGDTKFDLLLLGYALNDFQLAVAHQLKIPVVISWSNIPNSMVNFFVGNPITVGTEGIAFTQRLKSFFAHGFMGLVGKYGHYKLAQYYE